jgi:hypothetical protein
VSSGPYNPEFLADLDRVMSRARLSRYMRAAGDLALALQLYEKNLAISEVLLDSFMASRSLHATACIMR